MLCDYTDGFTYRGCASELDEGVCNSEENCLLCKEPTNLPTQACNNLIFPSHRHQCHQCRGAVNESCDAIPLGTATYCEMYEPNDRCYILRTSKLNTCFGTQLIRTEKHEADGV